MARSFRTTARTASFISVACIACGPSATIVDRPSATAATNATSHEPRVLVFRETRVGKIVKPRRTTWTLTLSDAKAELVVVEENAPNADTSTYAWQKGIDARYDGAIAHTGDRFALELARFCPSNGSGSDCTANLSLECAEETVEVRGPNAGFIDGDACKGDGPPPRETNVATKPIVIARCRKKGADRTLDFAEAPGIESYDQNDDCAGQFHTLRRIESWEKQRGMEDPAPKR